MSQFHDSFDNQRPKFHDNAIPMQLYANQRFKMSHTRKKKNYLWNEYKFYICIISAPFSFICNYVFL